ncbi:MAG: hypothetical protein IMW89_00855 [Ktedonobacteraceae bacterium]|nr:hypothetical protein [Ktedonobacteraceae bacterium]
MNLKWIKSAWIGLAAVAILALTAACSTSQTDTSSAPFNVPTSANTTTTNASNTTNQSSNTTSQSSGTTSQPANSPLYSPYVLVIPATGTCHQGGIQVRSGNSFTAEANGRSYPAQIDNTTKKVTFPTLPNSFAIIHVPAQTDLSIKECNSTVDVKGVGGQMYLSGSNIFASQVRLFGKSHLHVDNGTITFDGSLDKHSNNLFDANNGTIDVKLPKSDPFHIDAVTKAGNINTTLGTPAAYGSSGKQLHVSSQATTGAQLTVNLNSGSMNFNIV